MADGQGSEEEGALRKTSEVDTEEECCDSVYRWQQKFLSKMQLCKNLFTNKGEGGRTECKIFKYLSTLVFESILTISEDDAMEEDVVVTTPVTPGVSLHYPQVFATKRISKICMNYDLYQFQKNQHLKINTKVIMP